METRQMHYPGDPVVSVTLMTGAEFLAATPYPREIVFHVEGEPALALPVTDVLCDQCNAEIAPADFCALTMNRLYCQDCYNRWIQPHLLK
jgi:hypothetical protein